LLAGAEITFRKVFLQFIENKAQEFPFIATVLLSQSSQLPNVLGKVVALAGFGRFFSCLRTPNISSPVDGSALTLILTRRRRALAATAG